MKNLPVSTEISKALDTMSVKQRSAAKYLSGFFVLMVVLTFLSRAADSLTVPVVTIERISGGALEHKVVAEGSLYPVAQTAVFAPAGYRILALYAQPGDRVIVGKKLAELDVTQMQEQLDDTKAELERLSLTAAANASEAAGEADKSGIGVAERALERARADLEMAERETKLRVESAENDAMHARRYLRELRDIEDVPDMEISEAKAAVLRQELALDEAKLAREKALDAAERAVNEAEILLEQEKSNAGKSAETAAAYNRRKALEREASNVDIERAQKRLEELESLLAGGGVITANTGGVIMRMNGGVGSLTTAEGLFVISDSSAGVVFRTSVSEEELKHIRREDDCSIVLTGEGRAVDAVVESVSPFMDNGRYDVTVALPEGEWEPGVSGKMTVTQRSVSYPVCVSNGAVRKDQNGYFVLVLREIKGILGAQTVAERINVGVMEKGANRCAIDGLLGQEDSVIVGGSRPVSAGDRVRME